LRAGKCLTISSPMISFQTVFGRGYLCQGNVVILKSFSVFLDHGGAFYVPVLGAVLKETPSPRVVRISITEEEEPLTLLP
jgi:hypothetical protein